MLQVGTYFNYIVSSIGTLSIVLNKLRSLRMTLFTKAQSKFI